MARFWLLGLVAIVGPFTQALPEGKCHAKCRCLPSQPCWPSTAEWKALNQSVHGQLVQVIPVGNVCHEPTFDEGRCNELRSGLTYDARFRSAEPGAGSWLNWEAWESRNETCYVDSDKSIKCGQGRVSLYSVAVQTPEDIIATLKFANKNNIRLVVKNSGHDFSGRSMAPFSLQIHTKKMQDIKFTADFTLRGAPRQSPSFGPAVTIGAGVKLFELYKFCHEKNLTLIAGFSSTVGAAGGFTQGGGHSILSPWKGLGSDNVLEYTVVTANGKYLYVNQYENPDLFWALRGGGGGTFGIVTSVTFKAHENPPFTYFHMDIARPTADASFWKLIEILWKHLPGLNDDFGTSLSSVMYPNTAMPSSADGVPTQPRALVNLKGFVVGTATDEFRAALSALEVEWRSVTDNATLTSPRDFSFNVTTFPSITSFYTAALTGTDRSGASTIIGSRLVSRDFIKSPGGPSAIADAFSKIKVSQDEAISGNMVGGGAVAATGEKETGVNTAWRRALGHMMIVRGWYTGTPLAEQQAKHDELTNVQVPILKSLVLPGEKMGSYHNEGDDAEPDFQRSFWGDNYSRLYKIKQKWDPRGVFIVRKGVGSEDWDYEGMCRLK